MFYGHKLTRDSPFDSTICDDSGRYRAMTKMANLAPISAVALFVENLSRRYGSTLAVNQVSLTAQRGEIVCLQGQSGCGKAMLLRLIAGIEQPSGIVRFGSRMVSGPDQCVPPEHRAVGLVFQDWPAPVLRNMRAAIRACCRAASSNAPHWCRAARRRRRPRTNKPYRQAAKADSLP